MKKLAIYPFDYQVRELIYSFSLLKEYEIAFYIKRDKFSCSTFSTIDKNKLTENYLQAIDSVDTVFLSTKDPAIPYTSYLDIVYYAHKKGKEVIITGSLFDYLYSKSNTLLDICPDITIYKNADINPSSYTVNKSSLLNVNVPIIAIWGLGNYCNKFRCELKIRDFFVQQGYNVLQLGSKEISPLFGFNIMPEFVSDASTPYYDRAIGFNRYITEKINDENPDLIILGVSESILPYSQNILNGLGEVPLVITSAINIDISIINIYNQQQLSKEYISHLLACGKYRLNSSHTYINVSGTIADMQDDQRSLKYYHVGHPICSLDTLNNDIGEKKVFSLDIPNSELGLLDTLYGNLTNNIDIF